MADECGAIIEIIMVTDSVYSPCVKYSNLSNHLRQGVGNHGYRIMVDRFLETLYSKWSSHKGESFQSPTQYDLYIGQNGKLLQGLFLSAGMVDSI